ncbi:MAG: hypothetical protein A3F75_11630 [Betaproteobacteria bacterium RIFCSPLOWO2_12_FULL_64_23]|nr:MAG: hypothetical protein A3F75_11630 [Betaproteobacteria bacterium RIFCSPLOWO2_12_FULL_64_23]
MQNFAFETSSPLFPTMTLMLFTVVLGLFQWPALIWLAICSRPSDLRKFSSSVLILIFVLGAIKRKLFSLLWKLGLLEKLFVSRRRKVNA